MDRFESMQEWFIAEESILDKFKRKVPSNQFKSNADAPTFPSAEKFVEWAEQNGFEKKMDATVNGYRVKLRHFEKSGAWAIDRTRVATLIKNAIANIPKIHKEICKRIVDDYKAGERPWAWQERTDGKLSIAEVSKEVRFNVVDLSMLPSSIDITYWFDDGPSMIYGSHSLVVGDSVGKGNSIFDSNGRYTGKEIAFDLAG